MAAGLLAQSDLSVTTNVNTTAYNTSATIYTCPLTASYAVVHVYWNVTAQIRSGGSAGQAVSRASLTIKYGSVPRGSTSTSGVGGTFSSSNNDFDSIILGPGQTISIDRFAQQDPGTANAAAADFFTRILVTGYEV